MSDLISVETVDNVISNINEDNESYKSDKSYNINYNINDRLRFLQNKYKDCEIKVNSRNNKLITCRKKNSKRFRECCINFDCIIHPSSCIEGETKATHCGKCSKLAEEKENIKMKSIDNRKCIVCKKKQPSFCIEGETKPTHCSPCAQIVSIKENIEMINMKNKNRRCKNIIDGKQCKIQVYDKEKYDGNCSKCYFKINPTKIPIINRRIKENEVVNFIKLIYIEEIKTKYNIIDIRFDKQCGTTNKKPDIVIICESYVIVVEVDEFQHKKASQKGNTYSKENEENKMNIIREYYKSVDKKTIYKRFNPDDYLSNNNIKINSPWKKDENGVLVLVDETDWKNRLEVLKQKIDFYLKKKEIKNNSTNYLFYDGYKN
jgi:hypothetical protein